jgi:hypothetical protein
MEISSLFSAPAGAIATVSIIDWALQMSNLTANTLLAPEMKGFEMMPTIAIWSFVIESPSEKKAMVDLGVPPNLNSSSPAVLNDIQLMGWNVKSQSHVADILEKRGINRTEIDSIIWTYCRHEFIPFSLTITT